MGIKNIHEILKKYSENSYRPVHLSEYHLKKVAIDMSIYMFRAKARANAKGTPNQWLSDFIYLTCALRKNKIHPVFVYDTKAPVEKSDEHKKRAEQRQKQKERIANISKAIEQYHRTSDIDQILLDLCSDMSEKRNRLLGRPVEKDFDISVVTQKLEKLKAQVINVTDSDFKLTKELFDILTVPYIQAPGEAEAMCSYLCVHGIVDAVLSEDTDVLAYGAKKFLTRIDTVTETVVEIDRELLLSDLRLSPSSFLDLCIMCGTDYNTNIKGIGPEKSYNLIFQYESIEKIGEVVDKKTNEKKYDITQLKHLRSRELFSIPEKIDIDIPYTELPNMSTLYEFIRYHNLNIQESILNKSLRCTEIEFVD
jgi:flap endonuclease-1